ncbi:MAG: TssA family type VI secretion system protein [Deltaproteobacteria bacterium]|jgi:type VI secretion system protein VasJ|nr:TssA family type VI secretion system protein [Deltaproteobacteria bacterium]
MATLDTLGTVPIGDGKNNGRDIRLEPDFLNLQAEIDKLQSLSGVTNLVNWELVAQMSQKILEVDSKDILVASFLAVSLMENQGLEGLGLGANFLGSLIQNFWEELFPPLKRLRARVNALDWYFDKILTFIKNYTQPPVPAPFLETLEQSFQHLNQVLTEKYQPLGGLREILNYIKVLPREQGPQGASNTLPATLAVTSAPTSGPIPPVTPGDPKATAPTPLAAENQGKVSSVSPSQVSSPASPEVSPAVGLTVPPVLPFQPGEDAGKATFNYLGEAFSQYLSVLGANYDSPWRWLISRLRLWVKVTELPYMEGGITRIPAPPEELFQTLRSFLGRREYEKILNMVEDRIGSFIYSFDLNYYAHEALVGLGYLASAQALKDICYTLTLKFPGIQNYKFEDGTLFTGPQTRQWLETQKGAAASPTGFIDYEGLSQGDPQEALKTLENPENRPSGGRDLLRQKVSQMGLFAKIGHFKIAIWIAKYIVDYIEKHGLSDYDPKLVSFAFQECFFIFQGANPPLVNECQEVLFKLSLVDPLAVLKINPGG